MAGTFRESPPADGSGKNGIREPPSTSWRPRSYTPRTSPPSRPPRLPHKRGSGRPPYAGLCTAIAATALVMLSAATVVHAVSGDGGTWHGAWTAIIPDAFQFDRHGAAPPPAHALPEPAYAASGGMSTHAASGGGRGTWGSSLRDGSYEAGREGGWGGGASKPSSGHTLIPNAHAEEDGGTSTGHHTRAAPLPFHDRWALGEGLAQGSAYAYLICGAPADPPACFEATLVVVRRDDGTPVEGSAYSHAASPIPWHIRVTVKDLIGYYARDGSGFRMSDYTASGMYDMDMRTMRSAALFDGEPPDPWSFDLRFTGVRYEPRPVHPDPAAMRYAGALEDTIFLLGSKIAVEMGPYNDRYPILEDGEQWPNSVGAAVHVREAVSGYKHDYLYGTVDIRGGDPGSGRAMHRVSYTGDAVPMADLIVADGIPFPLSGSVRDAVLPAHFASDPHVDSRWWFRLVAMSAGPGMTVPSDSSGGMGEGTDDRDRAAPEQRSHSPPTAASNTTASGGVPDDGKGTGGTGDAAPTGELPPINIPRISGLLNNPDGLYAYLAELAGEMAAARGGTAGGTSGGTAQHPADMPPLTVSTDRASYARGQAVSISGMADAGDAGGASRSSPFVLISVTGQGGSSVASLLAPLDTLPAGGTAPYTATVDTSGWSAAQAPAGNMTVIAVRGADTAHATFELRDYNASAAQDRQPTLPRDAAAPPLPPPAPAAPAAQEARPPLTIAPGDVAYRHGETVVLSGTATARHVRDSLVLLTVAGPDGTTLAGLTTHVTPDGRYSRTIPTVGWPAEYGTVTVAAVRGTDTASATFELVPPSSTAPHEIPASAFPDIPGTGLAGANGTFGTVRPSPSATQPDPDIGSAGIRSHIRYMIDANQTVSDLIIYDHSIVVYLGLPQPNPPETTPTLWLRIPRTVMDPPDMDGDGRVFDVRIDGAVSTSHAETSDDTHRTLSIPVLHTTGVVDVSGPIASAPPDDSSSGGAAVRPSGEPPAPKAPAPPAQNQQCTGSARCLRATITSVPAADHIMLSGGMSVRLALVSVPAPLEPGGEQARRLVSSICPAGEQVAIDEDDLGASATSSTFRNRIVAEAYCNDGIVSIQDVLVASGLGTVDRNECSTSEFASRPWAAGECGTEERRQ